MVLISVQSSRAAGPYSRGSALGDGRPLAVKLAVMKRRAARADKLIEKIRGLPPEKAAEVEDFVDFLRLREDRRLTRVAGRLSEKALAKVWNNPDDAAYDRL